MMWLSYLHNLNYKFLAVVIVHIHQAHKCCCINTEDMLLINNSLFQFQEWLIQVGGYFNTVCSEDCLLFNAKWEDHSKCMELLVTLI